MEVRNEILYSLSKPGNLILVIGGFLNADRHRIHYFRRSFKIRSDFDASGVNYGFTEFVAGGEEPR